MKKSLMYSQIALILICLCACNIQNKEAMNKMSWIEGEWINEKDGELSIETWRFNNPAKLEGNGNILIEGDTVFSEQMFIEIIDSEITFTAIPSGKMATRFKLVLQEEKRLEFENLEHDFPQRIIYWQENENTLNARIEGLVNESVKSFDFSWNKVSVEK
ncbi:MAG: hypothetical protein H0V01_09215 [Bacteroidetes bacterium]|nr:hypothetical protein [Bacteroidota bacterium]HET6243081.1 DUF6265 family protein [Bacteroidia bacterium]